MQHERAVSLVSAELRHAAASGRELAQTVCFTGSALPDATLKTFWATPISKHF